MTSSREYDRDLLKLFDRYVHGAISRRQFLSEAARISAAGVSAAAILASLSPDYSLAQQVDPDDGSIRTDRKKYASPKGGGVMVGYYARPVDVHHKLPGVVVIHENRGLNPYIEDVARRLAVAGFIAFAPDALAPLGGYPGSDDEGREMQKQRDILEMTEDFAAAVQFVAEHPDCTGRVAAIGFCFGGGMAMRLAVRMPELAAAVSFYGRHPARDDAAKIDVPLMLHHGELDDRVNASWLGFEKVLREKGVDYEEFTYADANHGFHNDTTPRFDPEAAKLAWDRTVKFLNEHLRI